MIWLCVLCKRIQRCGNEMFQLERPSQVSFMKVLLLLWNWTWISDVHRSYQFNSNISKKVWKKKENNAWIRSTVKKLDTIFVSALQCHWSTFPWQKWVHSEADPGFLRGWRLPEKRKIELTGGGGDGDVRTVLCRSATVTSQTSEHYQDSFLATLAVSDSCFCRSTLNLWSEHAKTVADKPEGDVFNSKHANQKGFDISLRWKPRLIWCFGA